MMWGHLPERIFYSLSDLERQWGLTREELSQWFIHGELQAHVWMPLMSAYQQVQQTEGATIVLRKQLQHIEAGYKRIGASDCRLLFKYGWIELREFYDASSELYSLDSSNEGASVQLGDLVILAQEKRRFEKIHGMVQAQESEVSSAQRGGDLSFRKVCLAGEEYHFGTMQSAILRKLYAVAESEDPWLHGKQLLAEVGSQSFSLANVFKRHPWRELIDTNGLGHYRMSKQFLTTIGLMQ